MQQLANIVPQSFTITPYSLDSCKSTGFNRFQFHWFHQFPAARFAIADASAQSFNVPRSETATLIYLHVHTPDSAWGSGDGGRGEVGGAMGRLTARRLMSSRFAIETTKLSLGFPASPHHWTRGDDRSGWIPGGRGDGRSGEQSKALEIPLVTCSMRGTEEVVRGRGYERWTRLHRGGGGWNAPTHAYQKWSAKQSAGNDARHILNNLNEQREEYSPAPQTRHGGTDGATFRPRPGSRDTANVAQCTTCIVAALDVAVAQQRYTRDTHAITHTIHTIIDTDRHTHTRLLQDFWHGWCSNTWWADNNRSEQTSWGHTARRLRCEVSSAAVTTAMTDNNRSEQTRTDGATAAVWSVVSRCNDCYDR